MFSRAIEQCLVAAAFVLLLFIAYGAILAGGRSFGVPAPSSTPGPRVLFHAPSPVWFEAQSTPYLLARYWPWRAPLWNPHAGCGAPLAADPAFASYAPFNVLNALAPGPWAQDFWRLARLAVAGLGMILLMYRLGVRAGGALTAAAAFCMTDFASHAVAEPMFNVFLWLPAMLWAAEWLVTNPQKFWPAICLGLIGACALLGAEARALMVCGFIVAAFFFWRLLLARSEDEYADLHDCLLGLAGAGALMAGTTLFYSLPCLELRWLSHPAPRPAGAGAWPLLDEMILLFSPRFNAQNGGDPFSYPVSWLGVCPLILACFAIEGWAARARARLFFLLLAGCFALELTGFWVIRTIWRPLVSSGLGWDCFAPPLYLCLSALAGFGISNIYHRRTHPAPAAFLLVLLLLGYILLFWRIVSGLYSADAISAANEAAASRVEMIGFVILAFLTVTAGVAYAGARVKHWGPWLSAALALAALVEGWRYFSGEAWPARANDSGPSLGLKDWSQRPESRSGRIYCADENIPLKDVYRLDLLALPKDDASPFTTGPLTEAWRSKDLLGARYLLGDRSLRKIAQRRPEQFRLAFAEEIRIWENLQALPRAWFLPASSRGQATWRLTGDKSLSKTESSEALLDSRHPLLIEGPIKSRHKAMLDMAQGLRGAAMQLPAIEETTPGAIPTNPVAVEQDASTPSTQSTPSTPSTPSTLSTAFSLQSFAKSAEIVVSAPHKIVIQISAQTEPGWLILSDQYYPGWQVFVDGKWETIYRANECLRAVFVAPGAHRITFRYIPWMFYLGLGGTVFTWLCVIYFSRKAGGFRPSTYGLPVEYVSLK